MDRDEVKDIVIIGISQLLQVPPESISEKDRFSDLGVDLTELAVALVKKHPIVDKERVKGSDNVGELIDYLASPIPDE